MAMLMSKFWSCLDLLAGVVTAGRAVDGGMEDLPRTVGVSGRVAADHHVVSHGHILEMS